MLLHVFGQVLSGRSLELCHSEPLQLPILCFFFSSVSRVSFVSFNEELNE